MHYNFDKTDHNDNCNGSYDGVILMNSANLTTAAKAIATTAVL